MSSREGSFVERRRTPRVSVSGHAVVHAASTVVRCQIVDLSMGGARFQSTDLAPPELAVGAFVQVDLHLDGANTAWRHLRSHVQRIETGSMFCVAFDDIDAQFEDIVEDEVLAGLEGERMPRAVVVDLQLTRRARIAAALRIAGCSAVEASTPLDAITLIEQSKAHVALVLISERIAGEADPLIGFLRDEHPDIELVVIADRPSGARDRSGWLYADQPNLGLQLRRLVGVRHPPAWLNGTAARPRDEPAR
jgi:hypothetical protein